jgi:predicted TIM-barrel fold metal-dependent hydrolase
MTLALPHYLHRTFGAEAPETQSVDELLFSSDSHVIEPAGLWKRELPKAFQELAPDFGGGRPDDVKNPGATDRTERLAEMAADGVSAEVLFPTWGLKVMSLDDPELEEACVRVYNDWLIDYCQAAPDRLVGLAMLSVYNIEGAIEEMERCRKAGFRGVIIWQVPPPQLSFTSDHYEKLWAAAQDMEMPVNLHILSGWGYKKNPERLAGSNAVTQKMAVAMDSLHDIIYSGVLERYPRLKIVLAENEIGWIPYTLEQWDFYIHKGQQFFDRTEKNLRLAPSEYFFRQVYATFFNDAAGARMLPWWGLDNCMWSSDFPHSNSTWPHSREVVARDLGSLPAAARAKVVRENVSQLYGVPIPEPIEAAVATH